MDIQQANPSRSEPRGQRVLGWIAPGTWPAVVAALANRPKADQLLLVAAADTESFATPSLFGRGRRHDPQQSPETLTLEAAEKLLHQAAERLGRPCQKRVVKGRTERAITEEAQHADLLILARDGDLSRLGPSSLGPHTRFVIDHAPCKVEIVWPDQIPSIETLPTPPHEEPNPKHGPR
jgi:nucleotide-binding universal stress UspA family protein